MVSVDVPELFVMVGGLNVQLAVPSKPAHESMTVELKPESGVIVTVEVAESPAVTVAGDNAPADNANPGVVLSHTPTPTPVGKTMSGRPSPFMSATEKDGERAPLVGTLIIGAKVPSPLPNMIPLCTGLPLLSSSVTKRSSSPSPLKSAIRPIAADPVGKKAGRRVKVPPPFPNAT